MIDEDVRKQETYYSIRLKVKFSQSDETISMNSPVSKDETGVDDWVESAMNSLGKGVPFIFQVLEEDGNISYIFIQSSNVDLVSLTKEETVI